MIKQKQLSILLFLVQLALVLLFIAIITWTIILLGWFSLASPEECMRSSNIACSRDAYRDDIATQVVLLLAIGAATVFAFLPSTKKALLKVR